MEYNQIFLVLFSFLIIFLAALIQGAIGFGFALFATPLLLHFYLAADLILLIVFLSQFVTGVMTFTLREHIEFSLAAYMALFGAAGSLLGAYFLSFLADSRAINLVIALVVILFSIMLLTGFRRPIRHEKLGGIAAGLFSGVASTLTSFGGPPAILLLTNQNKEPLVFKATMSMFFFLKNIFVVISLLVVARVGPAVLYTGYYYIPAVLMGWAAGTYLFGKIPVKLFQRITIGIVLGSSCYILITSIGL